MLARKEGCFGCGQYGHRLRDSSSRQGQRGGNGIAKSITLSALASCLNRKDNSTGTVGVQSENKFYALHARQDQYSSHDVVTDTLRVFDFDI